MAKMTQTEVFERTIAILADADITEEECTELTDFYSKKIEMLANKAEKAKAKAAEKTPEPDELMDIVKDILSKDLQTAEQIASQITVDGEAVSRQKVSARLTKLTKMNVAVKGEVLNEETGKKYAGYRLA